MDYLRLVSPPKGDHSNHERRAEPPSGGAGKVILWPEKIARKFRKYRQVDTQWGTIYNRIYERGNVP